MKTLLRDVLWLLGAAAWLALLAVAFRAARPGARRAAGVLGGALMLLAGGALLGGRGGVEELGGLACAFGAITLVLLALLGVERGLVASAAVATVILGREMAYFGVVLVLLGLAMMPRRPGAYLRDLVPRPVGRARSAGSGPPSD